MRASGEARPGALAIIKKRRLVLALVAVLSALAALPFALSVPPQYQSSAQVLIPASDPVSLGNNAVSRISVQLAAYAKTGLAQDVSRSLGDQVVGLRSVTAVQLRDQDLWLVTALASSPSVAQRVVSVAARTLIDRSNELAETMVQTLASEVSSSLAWLNRSIPMLSSRILRIQREEQGLSRKINQLRHSGTNEGVAAAKTKLHALRSKRLADVATLGLEKSKRSAYPGLVQRAFGTFQERRAASALIAPAPLGRRSAPAGLVATIGLAVLAGLLVGVLLVFWIERRSDRRLRATDGLSHAAPIEGHDKSHAATSLESTKRQGA